MTSVAEAPGPGAAGMARWWQPGGSRRPGIPSAIRATPACRRLGAGPCMLVLLLLGGCNGHGWVCHNDADADNTLLFSYDAGNNTVTVGGGPTHHRNASWVRRLETGDWGAYLEHDQQVQLCQDRQGTPPCRLTNSIYRYRFDHATGTLRYRLSYQPPQPAWPPLEINYTCTRSATLPDRVVTGAGRHW